MENEEDKWDGPKFSPPVYQQRYAAVARIVKASGSKKVLDVGCSEAKFLTYLKLHCPLTEVIIGVDIDKDVLSLNHYRIKPLITEYLFKRTLKLQMALYEGSIIEPDVAFKSFDFLSCIEVIEHLHEESLAYLPSALFGIFRANTIVITTPNADFNVLFPNFTGFRHPDHKFEWTRNEFQSWCLDCCELFGYSVEFSYVGDGPKDKQHLGGCSQMAVFKLKPSFTMNESLVKSIKTSTYRQICNVEYPYKAELSLTEKIAMELRYIVEKYFFTSNEYDDCSSIIRIPLDEIMSYHSIKTLSTDRNLLRTVASDIYNLSEDKNEIIINYDDDNDNDNNRDSSLVDDDQTDFLETTTQNSNMISGAGTCLTTQAEEYWD